MSVQSTAKFYLLERGLAGTPYLAERCKQNGGSYKIGEGAVAKTYRLPTETEFAEALIYALELEYRSTHQGNL